MTTAPEAVRSQLAVVSTAAATDLTTTVATAPVESQVRTALEALPLIVPTYYDAAGSLAVAWYGELRDASRPVTTYAPSIIGDPATDWIDQQVRAFRAQIDATALDLVDETQKVIDEIAALAQKEVARGFRDSILGNTRSDQDAIGWSRVARGGACKFCQMLAGKGSVYRSESSAIFAAHKACNCAARPEFRNGDHGPEASAIQYAASSRRAKDERVQAQRNARVRAYLNKHYPDARG